MSNHPKSLLKGKHTIPAHQHSEIHHDQKIEELAIQSTSTYSLNGQVFQIDFREKGVTILDVGLEIGTSGAVSGLTGTVTNYPNLNPVSFWNTRIDFLVGGQVLFSVFDVSQFIRKQLFQIDGARAISNYGEGLYSSSSQRNELATASSYYYLDLWTRLKSHFITLTI